MIHTELTKKALVLSFNKHKDQIDKSGIPYVYHPFIVASKMQSEEQVCVALLHDVLEDTNTTALDLMKEGFPNPIIEAVLTMTHKANEDYFTYIKRIKANPIARIVKIADLKHNSDLTRLNEVTDADLQRIEKYKKALAMIVD